MGFAGWNPKRKYGNQKTEFEGLSFDSKHEFERWVDLRLLEKAGEIQNLRRQVKFELLPAQRGELRTERGVSYIADFVYEQDGKTVVEDAKSKATRTPEYIIKRKLMRWRYGIEVKEV